MSDFKTGDRVILWDIRSGCGMPCDVIYLAEWNDGVYYTYEEKNGIAFRADKDKYEARPYPAEPFPFKVGDRIRYRNDTGDSSSATRVVTYVGDDKWEYALRGQERRAPTSMHTRTLTQHAKYEKVQ